jgi:hypothetical protein
MRRAFVVVAVFALTLLAGANLNRVSTSSASATLTQVQDRGNPAIRVWVDTAYGYYYCPNTTWYGKTKQGVYMTQKEAQDKTYKPATTVCK